MDSGIHLLNIWARENKQTVETSLSSVVGLFYFFFSAAYTYVHLPCLSVLASVYPSTATEARLNHF